MRKRADSPSPCGESERTFMQRGSELRSRFDFIRRLWRTGVYYTNWVRRFTCIVGVMTTQDGPHSGVNGRVRASRQSEYVKGHFTLIGQTLPFFSTGKRKLNFVASGWTLALRSLTGDHQFFLNLPYPRQSWLDVMWSLLSFILRSRIADSGHHVRFALVSAG